MQEWETIRYADDVIWDVVDDKVVLCKTAGGDLFELNATGSDIWRWCREARFSDMVARLQQAHPDKAVDHLVADVSALLVSLRDAGLVVVTGEASVAAGARSP